MRPSVCPFFPFFFLRYEKLANETCSLDERVERDSKSNTEQIQQDKLYNQSSKKTYAIHNDENDEILERRGENITQKKNIEKNSNERIKDLTDVSIWLDNYNKHQQKLTQHEQKLEKKQQERIKYQEILANEVKKIRKEREELLIYQETIRIQEQTLKRRAQKKEADLQRLLEKNRKEQRKEQQELVKLKRKMENNLT